MKKTSSPPDWFVKAAAAAGEVDDNAKVEQAFADQAYQIIANKSGPLMRDPYRLGFEVVWRNDTATRIVGIFAFRVGDQLYYVPVFFLQGEICGSDLLYQVGKRKFIPNQEEWANFLINRDAQGSGIGKGVSQDLTRRMQPVHYLDRLAGPPATGHVKFANLGKSAEEWKTLLDSMVPENLETVKSASAGPSILDKFLSEDGMFDLLMNAMEKHATFANEVLNGPYDIATFPQRYIPVEPLVKQASAEEKEKKPELRILRSIADVSDEAGLVKLASAGGYLLEDTRAVESCSKVAIDSLMIKSSAEKLKEQTPDQLDLCAITTSGIYDILLADGTLKTGRFFPRKEFSWHDGFCGESCAPVGSGSRRYRPCPQRFEHIILWEDKTVTRNEDWRSLDELGSTPFGLWKSDSIDDDLYVAALKEGKVYQLVDKASKEAVGDPVVCTSVSKRGKVTLAGVMQRYGGSTETRITVNPDLPKSDTSTFSFGADYGWLELSATNRKREKDDCCEPLSSGYSDAKTETTTYHPGFDVDAGPVTGNEGALHNILFGDNSKLSLSVTKSASGYLMEMDRVGSIELKKTAAVRFLARPLGIHGNDIMSVFDELENRGTLKLAVCIPGDNVVKRASAFVRLTQQPRFTETVEPDFGLVVRTPEEFRLATESYSPAPPASRYGDAADPTLGHGHKNENSSQQQDRVQTISNEELMRLSPEDLGALANQRKAPSVFDHGVVASLVHMEDAMAYVDKYLPHMEDGLDAIGRMIFMICWKPADFEQAFGKQEMPSFENDLLSNWKSFGRLVLTLMKRMRVSREQPNMLKSSDS